MRPIIEFCVNNTHHGTDKVMTRLEGNPEYDVLEYGCLGNCGGCLRFLFALVNGEIVAGETTEELYEKIINKIEEIRSWEQLDID